MEAKHTPGPWTIKTVTWDNGDRDAFIIKEMEDEYDAAIDDAAIEKANDRAIANRNVMEAAPDLLAACEVALKFAEFAQINWHDQAGTAQAFKVEMRAAIAKARGGE